MKKVIVLISILCLLGSFSSCKSYFIMEESYPMNETIIIKNYLFQINDDNTINAPDDIGDSLFRFFKNQMLTFDLPLKLVDGGENKVDYFFLKEGYLAGPYKGVDTSLIIKMVDKDYKNNQVLIPFIEVFNRSIGSVGGYTYRSFAKIVIFIVRDGKVIYRYSNSISSDVHFEPEYKKIKRNINTKEDWEKAINGAMKEYINRLE